MITQTYSPESIQDAESHLNSSLTGPIEQLSATEFARAWSSVRFPNPCLHPGGYKAADSGWLDSLRKVEADAWRRFDTGEIGEAVRDPSVATHAGLLTLIDGPRVAN